MQKQKLFLFVQSSPVHNYPKVISCKEKVTANIVTSFKPNVLPVLCMAPPQHPSDNPHQIQFNSDSQKILIDSGASVHLWAHHKDLVSYHVHTKDEQERDQVLGVSSTMIRPLGISSVKVLVEDDQSDVHTLHLHEVHHIPSLPINIFVPQVFVQQRQQEEQLTPNTTKTTLPHHSQSEGVVTDFTMMPHTLPTENLDQPLLKADQDLLMRLHEQFGHCSFHQLCQLAESGIIPK